MTHYVSIFATCPDDGTIVLLEKLRGPPSVVGKITVPGGKVDPGETSIAAAVRELKEESGLEVAENDLIKVHSVSGSDYMIDFYWFDGDISEAKPQEDEPEKVFIGRVADVIENADGKYMEDVSDILRGLNHIIY